MAIVRLTGSAAQSEIRDGTAQITLVLTPETDITTLQAGQTVNDFERWDSVKWPASLTDLSSTITGSLSGAGSWNDEVSLSSGNFTRVDDHHVTLSIPATAAYSILEDEELTCTLSASDIDKPTNWMTTITSGKFIIREGDIVTHPGVTTISAKTEYTSGVHYFPPGSTLELHGRPLIVSGATLRIAGNLSNRTTIKYLNASGNSLSAAEQSTISGNSGALTIMHVPTSASQIGDELSATGIWIIDKGNVHTDGEEVQPYTEDGTTNGTGWDVGNHDIYRWNSQTGYYDVDDTAQMQPITTAIGSSPAVDGNVARSTPRFGTWYAPICNYTRSITFTGYGHLMDTSDYPSTYLYTALGDAGVGTASPHNIAPSPTGFVNPTGRYALHFHHKNEGSVGTWLEGMSGWGTANHFIVKHSSHDIFTYNYCFAMSHNAFAVDYGPGQENAALNQTNASGYQHTWWDPGHPFPFASAASVGSNQITLDVSTEGSATNPDDEFRMNSVIFISDDQGDTGEFHKVLSVSSGTITLQDTLQNSYGTGAFAFSNVTRGAKFQHGATHGFKTLVRTNGYTIGFNFLGTAKNGTSGYEDCIGGYSPFNIDSSVFHWPAQSNSMPNIWIFMDIIAHNMRANGFFTWQNTKTDPHNFFNCLMISCLINGDDSGAYVTEGYHHGGPRSDQKMDAIDCGHGFAIHAVSPSISRGDGYGFSWENWQVTAADGYGFQIAPHSLPGRVPTLVLNSSFSGATDTASGKIINWDDGSRANVFPSAIDIVECGLSHTNKGTEFRLDHPDVFVTRKLTLTQATQSGDTSIIVSDASQLMAGSGYFHGPNSGLQSPQLCVGGEAVDIISQDIPNNELFLSKPISGAFPVGTFVWGGSFVRVQELASNSTEQSFVVASDGETQDIDDFYFPALTDNVTGVQSPPYENSDSSAFTATTSAQHTTDYIPAEDSYIVVFVGTRERQAAAPSLSGGGFTWTLLEESEDTTDPTAEHHLFAFGAEIDRGGGPATFLTVTATLDTSSPGSIVTLTYSGVEDTDPVGATQSDFVDLDGGASLQVNFTNIERQRSRLVSAAFSRNVQTASDDPVGFNYREGAGLTSGPSVDHYWLTVSDVVHGTSSFKTFDWNSDNSGGFDDPRIISIELKGEAASGTVPGPPTNVQVAGLERGATVSWTAPADTGGTALTGYEIHPSPNEQGDSTIIDVGIVGAGTTEYTFETGTLDAGQEYLFTVFALNSAGSSLGAGSSPITIQGSDLSFLYQNGMVQAVTGGIDWDTDTIKAALLETKSGTDPDHTTVQQVFNADNELTSTGYARVTVTNPTAAVDNTNNKAVLRADNITFSALTRAATEQAVGILLYKEVTDDTDSIPIAFLDNLTYSNLPYTPSGKGVTFVEPTDGLVTFG